MSKNKIKDILVRKKILFEEVQEKDMCDALRELFHDEIEEAKKQARYEGYQEGYQEGYWGTLIELIQDGLVNVTDAAKALKFSEEELKAKLSGYKRYV